MSCVNKRNQNWLSAMHSRIYYILISFLVMMPGISCAGARSTHGNFHGDFT